MRRVLIAMSGGVDSSAAACLMKEQGFDCCGATMKLFDNTEYLTEQSAAEVKCSKTCCALSDVEDARSVAYRLNMPFHVFNFIDLFQKNVIDRFAEEYQHARTPNPCIDCNRFVKFERFLRRAEELDFDYIATGHYARIEYDDVSRRYLLKRAVDETKDQSYVLYAMTQQQLAKTKFPLGRYRKQEIRQLAQEHGFVNAAKRESQDICFVPNGDYGTFIEHYTGKKWADGSFVNTEGKTVGTHRGLIRYTVGQRKGLGIADKTPYYVCGFNIEENSVLLCKEHELYSKTLEAADINLIVSETLSAPMKVQAKVRYRQKAKPATVEQTAPDRIRVEFNEPLKAVTPGQAVVLYDGDTVIGGGTITASAQMVSCPIS
ncbi:MAG: tRNA 2-thiouridine(34) synthase MnmA [Planctomycetaceae bacterium]|jgi:tRNA-specific 2-thiouridylase|nr:tRNA 2-thiouridine(34) synthase MnmA [Planctomycetaceae bacterium]